MAFNRFRAAFEHLFQVITPELSSLLREPAAPQAPVQVIRGGNPLTQNTQTQERSTRVQMYQALTSVPHRLKGEGGVKVKEVFAEAMQRDPLFAGKAFYALTLSQFNAVRDLGEAGVAFLLNSPHAEHREAGRVLLGKLEPYRVVRAIQFIADQLKPNRQVHGAVAHWLRELEVNPSRWHGAVRRSRKGLKFLYKYSHVKPSALAQAYLFEGKRGDDPVSRLAAIEDPTEQARHIVKFRIPYTVATSSLKALTPPVWAALIEVASPVEALNMRGAVESAGILEIPELKELYLAKIARAAAEGSRAGVGVKERASVARGADADVDAAVQQVTEAKVAQKAIEADVLLAPDVSSSMTAAIEMCKALGAFIAPSIKGELRVVAFNDNPLVIKVPGEQTQADWEKAFKLVRADGSTAMGAPLVLAKKHGWKVDRLVFITDQGHNAGVHPVQAYKDYVAATGHEPAVIFVDFGNDRNVSRSFEQNGIQVTDIEVAGTKERGWYMVLDQVLLLLQQGGRIGLIERILDLELPSREAVKV